MVRSFLLYIAESAHGGVVSSHGFSVFSKVAVASYVLKVLSGLSPFIFLQGNMNLVIGFGKHIIGVSGLRIIIPGLLPPPDHTFFVGQFKFC